MEDKDKEQFFSKNNRFRTLEKYFYGITFNDMLKLIKDDLLTICKNEDIASVFALYNQLHEAPINTPGTADYIQLILYQINRVLILLEKLDK